MKMSEKKSNKKLWIISIVIAVLIIIAGVSGYFIYQNYEQNKTVGTAWGDTYYTYLKSVKEADEDQIVSSGLSKDITTAQVQFIQLEKEDDPKMILTYQKNDETYTNIYYINNEQKVTPIIYDNSTTLELLYNRELKEYKWYLYSKENEENLYQSLDKILEEIKDGSETDAIETNAIETDSEGEQQLETNYTDYTFTDEEMKSNFEVADGEIPTISEFDKTFIKVEIDQSKISEINFEGEDKELKQIITETVEGYKTKEETVTEEVKAKTEEEETTLENKEEEIKQLEEKKRQEEEAAAKVAEEAAKKAAEEAAKKAAEEAEKTSAVQTGKYTLSGTGRDGALTIKSATGSSIQFEIGVVNLYGGYHMGELSATATKTSGNKYVYTNTEYGQTYKFYMEVSGNSIVVTTSKMLNGDGFDPFCGVNAYFDGTYTK